MTHTRTAIGGLRALGRSGLRVAALGPHRFAAGLRSRYASAAFVGPDVLTDPGGFAAGVASIARDCGPLVVYPVQEEAIDALFDASPALPTNALSRYPGPEPVRRQRDKRALPALAAEQGLRSAHVLAEASAADLASAALPFPCIIKPVGKGGAPPTARSSTAECLRPKGVLEILAPDPAILEQTIRSARACGIANIVARPGDARALPYPDEIFDAVYLVFGLGDMHDPRGELLEAARVLEPAGRVVIGGLPRSLPWLRCRTLEVLAVGVALVFEQRSIVRLVCLARLRRPSVVEI